MAYHDDEEKDDTGVSDNVLGEVFDGEDEDDEEEEDLYEEEE